MDFKFICVPNDEKQVTPIVEKFIGSQTFFSKLSRGLLPCATILNFTDSKNKKYVFPLKI